VALSDFFAMVVPIYLVTDAYFIKVLQGKYLKTQDPNESFILLTENEAGLNAPLLNSTGHSLQTLDFNPLLASENRQYYSVYETRPVQESKIANYR